MLRGGNSQHDGRVEICRNNDWGTICGEKWDERDAAVVCRQLGFSPQGTSVWDYNRKSLLHCIYILGRVNCLSEVYIHAKRWTRPKQCGV